MIEKIKPQVFKEPNEVIATFGSKINELIDTVNILTGEKHSIEADCVYKNPDCPVCPKEKESLDIKALLDEYALINDSNYREFGQTRERSKEILEIIRKATNSK